MAAKILTFIVLNVVQSNVCHASGIAYDVIVSGTTLQPRFKRNEGRESLECPASYPWAFNFGLNCCQFAYQSTNPTQPLEFDDPLQQCSSAVPCPDSSRICVENDVAYDIDPCPPDHPLSLNYGLHCCSNLNRANNTALNQVCDGGKLLTTDPAECCLNGDYQLCSNGTRFCNTTITEVLIVRQDLSDPSPLFTVATYLSLNPANTSARMYSRLADLESFRLSTGKFHLKLCYPQLNDTVNGTCFEFKQESNPLTITDVTQDVAGLEVIRKPYPNEYVGFDFTGLRSDSAAGGYSFLDGNKGTQWWNAIASMMFYELSWIPAVIVTDPVLPYVEKVTLLAELSAVVYN